MLTVITRTPKTGGETALCPLGPSDASRRYVIVTVLFVLLAVLAVRPAAAGSQPDEARTDRFLEAFKPTTDETAAGAVVLVKERRIVSRGNGHIDRVTYVLLAIIDKKAVGDYSEISIPFNSYFTDAKLDFARLIDASGRRHPVLPDATQTKTRNSSLMYTDSRDITFAPPALEPGSFIEFQVSERTLKPAIPGHWYESEVFHYIHRSVQTGMPRIDPLRHGKIVVEHPDAERLQAEARVQRIEPTAMRTDGRTTLTWEVRELGQVTYEPGMLSLASVVPGVVMTTLPGWVAVDTWGAAHYLPSASINPEVSALAKSLARGSADRQQRIQAAFHYMQDNIRYIAADVRRGGLIPHPVGEVLKHKYGDCKDQAILLVNILRALGIEAYPALTSPYPHWPADSRLASTHFSHMIVYVPDSRGDLWLDTSGSVGEFPGAHWTLENRQAFVINGKGGKLLTIPASPSSRNRVLMQVDFSYEKDGLIAKVRYTGTGAFAEHLRALEKGNRDVKEMHARSFKTLYSSAELRSIEIPSLGSLRGPYEIKGIFYFPKSGAFDTPERPVYLGGSLEPLVRIMTSYMDMPNPAKRRYDYHGAFAMTLRMETRCPRPSAEHRNTFSRSGGSFDSELFSVRHSATESADMITVTNELEMRQPIIRRTAYDRFVRDIKKAVEGTDWALDYQPDKQFGERRLLEEALRVSNQSITAKLNLARHYIKIGDYDKARPMIEGVIAKESKNGEAHYLLGVTLGFLDQYQASKHALERAHSLGYRP